MRNPESYDQWISMGEEEDVPALASQGSRLSTGARAQLLARLEEHVAHRETRTKERTHVAFAKLLIAMIPDSWPAIRTWVMDRGRTGFAAEVQFSLFCFLDELPRLGAGRELISEAASLVGDYLLNARSDTASATWMAGDLLGDHWDPCEAVPILLDVLAKGKYAEGRLAAIHGLEHAIARPDCSDALGESILRAIARLASDDRSRRVRESAQDVCDGVSVCSRKRITGKGMKRGRS